MRSYPWEHKSPDDVVVGPWPGSTTDSTDRSSEADNEKTETDEAPGPDGRKRPAPPSLLGAAWYYGDPVPEQPPMLVPSFVPARGFGYLGGQWGTFKTFLLNDLAVAVASGGKFAGQQVTSRGVVIQIELEGSNNEARMLAAATVRRCEREALPIVHLKKEPPKILMNTQPNPRFREWMAQLVEYAKTVAAQFDLPLLLITIDPQSKVAGFKDEQSSSEGQVVSDAFAELARLAGCTVLVVDHFGKDQTAGLRGTSAKETNPLFILGTSEQQKDIYARRRLEIRKMRNGPSGTAIDFWMEDYEVVVQQIVRSETGTTTEPVSVKTLVICWDNELRPVGSTTEKRRSEVRPASGKALAILIEMIREIGMALPEECAAPAGGRGVTTAVWRQELIKQQVIGGKNPGAGFAKVRDGLLAHNEIGMDGEYVWVIAPPLDD